MVLQADISSSRYYDVETYFGSIAVLDEISGSYVALHSLLRTIWQRFYLFAAIAILFCVATTVVVMRLQNVYLAHAEVLLPAGTRAEGAAESPDSPQDNANVRTEALLVQSESLIRTTVQTLGLDRDEEFTGGSNPDAVSLRALLSRWLQGGAPPPSGNDADTARAMEHLSQYLSATRLGETHLISVSFRSRSPLTAQRVVNAVVGEYLAVQTATRVAAMQEMQKLLTTPLQELRDAARNSEESFERYRQANGLYELGDVPLIARQIAGLTEQLVLARAALAEAESRAEETGTAQGNRQDVAVQRAREQALDRELTRLQREYDRQTQAKIQANSLQREAAMDQALHTAFMERSKQLQIRMLTERPSATVVTWAQLPIFPAAPRRLLLLAVGCVASLAVALAGVLVLPTPRRRGLAMDPVPTANPR